MADHRLFQRSEDDLLTDEIEAEKRAVGKKKAVTKATKKRAKKAARKQARRKR